MNKLRGMISTLLLLNVVYQAFCQNPCDKRSCYPATGNLVIGRADRLFASSTCGLVEPEDYCIVSHLQDSNECFVCDASIPENNHTAPKMISEFNGKKERSWWQSENLKEDVFIQLDLEAQFHFTHLVMTFRTFRPAGMIIERSWDYGRHWNVYRYFAADCKQTFPDIPDGPQVDVDDIICTEDFSSVEPSSDGEVIFRALNPQIPVKNPYSEKVQNLLKLTNIRINFTKLHTLGDLVLDPTKPDIKLKYYYAVYDLVIRGSCSCYGHAEQCLPLPGEATIPGMVYGQCDCTHNTEGKNCERCKKGFNDTPWRPASPEDSFECTECDCNGHADECRFDPAVYAASGNVSGGVCVNCLHSTVGRKCEKCKPLHYQDPARDFRDVEACIPCNCDSVGGVSGGECEGKTDPVAGLVAGRCICKRNVEGIRCNRCKPGYWNLQSSNPDGCEACSCNSLGTTDPCDAKDGKCMCKRLVMGARCDRCQPGFWGLSAILLGCKTCECDVGGSYERNCEQLRGQCRCRTGITGRRCDQVETWNYVPLPDHLKYESEEAKIIGGQQNGKVIPREPIPGETVTWTGDGFTEVKDDAALEYAVTNVPYTGEYNLLVRYEPKDSGLWKINVKIERTDGLPLTSGECQNATYANEPYYGNFTTALSTPRYALFLPSVCLEKDVSYVVKVTYSRHESNSDGTDTILTDSLVLVPNAEDVSIFQGPDGEQRKKEFDRNKCLSYHLNASFPRPDLPPVCKRLIFAMSSVIYDGGKPCNCDPTGTKRFGNGTLICDAIGGQCQCKPLVIGQRCDRCAPGSFNFGEEGCTACNCDRIGSSDNLCDQRNGQCACRIKAGGRQCNLCPPRNWGFPTCQPCVCNNHASSCDPETGECIDCQHSTAGKNCEVCATGYYGDSTGGTPNDCLRCQCPGGSSENQFSQTCFLDRSSTPPSSICDSCEEGYTGRQCEECDDGYFGNPLVPGGRCQPCSCNNNINPSNIGNCDRLTGRCLACMFNTAGFSCERCKSGYFGDALVRNCTECVCNVNGTDPGLQDTCNFETGQCKCLPNVIGIQCDKCADGFWNLGSGVGCEKCDCCGKGSTQATCSEDSGQCNCKPGFGGPRCCECEDNYWGIPPSKCTACDCNPAGSLSLQCDRNTGECQCQPGVIGDKCDMCDVDTSGKMPQCKVCGGCYYQWKVTLESLSRNVSVEVPRAYNLSLTPGKPGDINTYDPELKELEEKLKRVEEILRNQVTTENDTKAIEEQLKYVNTRLLDLREKVAKLDNETNSTEIRTKDANIEIERLRERLANLLRNGMQLKSDVDKLRRSDVRGAFEEIVKNQMRSREAQMKVNSSRETVDMIKEQRNKTELLLSGPPSLEEKHDRNNASFIDISEKIKELLKQVDILNGIICGTPSSKCGGCNALNCSVCGGPGCNGTVALAAEALERAKEAEEALFKKEAKAIKTLEEVEIAEVEVNTTTEAAEEAVMRAMEADDQARNASSRMDKLIQDILEFLSRTFGNTDQIRQLVTAVKNLKLSVTREEISKLAEDIRKALAALTGIDDILQETEERLNAVNNLKERAEQARAKAVAVSDVINNITDALVKAAGSQAAAQNSINAAEEDVKMAENTLKQLLTGLDALEDAVDAAQENVTDMANLVPVVQEQFENNIEQLNITRINALDAHNQSQTAQKEVDELYELLKQADVKINSTADSVQVTASNVTDLKRKADELINNLERNQKKIIIIEREIIRFENLVNETRILQEETKGLLDKLEKRSRCYVECNPSLPRNDCFDD